jgi:hypothetical protein
MFTNSRVPTPRWKKRGDALRLGISSLAQREPGGDGKTYSTAPVCRSRNHGLNRGTRRRDCRAVDGTPPSPAPARSGCNRSFFPHTQRLPYRQPAADAALEPCSATKTSFCSERNGSSSSRNTRTAAAGAARPGIDRHQPGFTPVLPDVGLLRLGRTRPCWEAPR